MSKRSRIVGFGSAGLLILAGIACAFAFSGSLGQNLAFGLVALGLVEGTALVFFEVGLTEDRDRAREERARADAAMERDRAERDRAERDPAHPDDRARGDGTGDRDAQGDRGHGDRGAQGDQGHGDRGGPVHPPERSGRVRLDRDRSHLPRPRRPR